MRARAVIGANYGDEGKGLVTDYLCAKEGAGVVVRFNGGAQAGHTVVTPEGTRHVFHHFGSGTFLGIPTFLSRFFVCNPILFGQERSGLVGAKPEIWADPECLVTTFADMLYNQRLEDVRDTTRHGSCGVGFNATIVRHKEIPLRMNDLWRDLRQVEPILEEIIHFYQDETRLGKTLEVTPEMIESFLNECHYLAEHVSPATPWDFEDPVFEGAQGLLLDQNRYQDMPYLTRSNTGMQNVRRLCDEMEIDGVLPYYVSRAYLTRHGAGPLPGEWPYRYADDTNVDHPYQGALRFAPLDQLLQTRCRIDARGDYRLVITHCDQVDTAPPADLYSFGPSRGHVVRA